jgi:hypothetical protein
MENESNTSPDELSEEDLLLMDQQFLQSMNEKNQEHSLEDCNDQTSFFIFVIFILLLLFGVFWAFYWCIKGSRIRKRRKVRLVLTS